jgi:ligand-binding sensor domain-containing protein/signal transduction histidine kinase
MKDMGIKLNLESALYKNHTSMIKDDNGNYYFGNAHNYTTCYHPKEKAAEFIGLPSIYTFAKDNKGNIWLGGFASGLVKYDIDANALTRYASEENNPYSMPHNRVWDIFIDKDNNVWSGTNNGVAKLSAKSNQFQHIRNIANNTNTIISSNVKDIIQAQDSSIWVSTIAGLSNINLKNNKVKSYTKENNSLIHNRINNLYQDKNGVIWIGGWSGSGFNSYNPITKKFSNHVFDPYSNSSDWYVGFAEDHNNKFYTAMWGGGSFTEFDRAKNEFTYKMCNNTFADKKITAKVLFINNNKLWNKDFGYFNVQNKSYYKFWAKKQLEIYIIRKTQSNKEENGVVNIKVGENINTIKKINESLYFATNHGLYKYIESNNKIIKVFSKELIINDIAESDIKNCIWLGTTTGLYLINLETGKELLHLDSTNTKLSDIYINSIYFDKNNVLWIGTKTALFMLTKSNTQKSKYHIIRIDNRFTNCNIIDIEENKNGIWIASSKGLNRINNNSDSISNYNLENSNISSNNIYALHTDAHNKLWIATVNGLNRYNTKTDNFTIWKHNPKDAHSIVDNKIYSIAEDDSACLYLGTDYGISKFNTITKSINKLKTKDNKHLYYGLLSCVYTDSKGEIWIGLYNSNAIERFNPDSGTFTHFFDYSYDSTSYKGYVTNFIYEDNEGIIWIGSDKGLNKFNSENNSFVHYSTKDGFPTNSINGMLEDNKGTYWISTNNGLVHFSKEKGVLKVYTKKDGLQSDIFSENAYCTLFDGRLAFAGDRGITIFNPDSIKISNKQIKPIFTKLHIYDSLYYGDLATIKNVDLDYSQNNFQVEFTVLEYLKPQKHKYKYKLIGYDNDWILTDYKNRKAKYTNLPYGTYILLLKATNSDGVWSNKEARIQINIIPPFWHTTIAYVGYFILTVILIILLIKFRTRQIKEKNKQLEIAIAERTKEILKKNEKITEQKISDLLKRHQLDSIKDKISGEEKERRRLASELHDGIGGSIAGIKLYLENMLAKSDSLELRTILKEIEKTYDEVRNISHDLVPPEFEYSSIMEVVSSYINQVKTRSNINVSLDIFPQTGWNNIEDRLQVEIYRIIQELMTNALKHSKASEIDIQLVLHQDLINISIEDNGVGINKKKIKKGIGLNNIENRITRLNGKLNIENSKDGGTIIIIDIPLTV